MSISATTQGRPWPARLTAVAAAVLVALAIWVLAELVLGIRLRAPEGFGASGDIDALNVATVSALASLAAWGSLAILERLIPRAHQVWRGARRPPHASRPHPLAGAADLIGQPAQG